MYRSIYLFHPTNQTDKINHTSLSSVLYPNYLFIMIKYWIICSLIWIAFSKQIMRILLAILIFVFSKRKMTWMWTWDQSPSDGGSLSSSV